MLHTPAFSPVHMDKINHHPDGVIRTFELKSPCPVQEKSESIPPSQLVPFPVGLPVSAVGVRCAEDHNLRILKPPFLTRRLTALSGLGPDSRRFEYYGRESIRRQFSDCVGDRKSGGVIKSPVRKSLRAFGHTNRKRAIHRETTFRGAVS